uniref:Retrotransposon Copia-like N-terminal domain-containing protein n=1 Tax=Manihot esculenta TaxID=3983 RepID=A0A2C9UZG6_MANES
MVVSASSDPTQSPSGPYFLHSNENPALVLISPVLTCPNYHTWSRAMKMALLSKNKMKFVDGIIQAPAATDLLCSTWERWNMMVLFWIM